MATVAEIFSQAGLIQWWNATVTQGWNGQSEKGIDYGLGGMGKPVGSLTSGKVVYVGNGGYPGSSIGQIVQVLNPDGSLVHYQHLRSANVTPGQQINVGTVVGSGGGCPVGAYFSDPSQNACQFYDSFSTGQHIEVRYSPSYDPARGVWSQAWENPQEIFKQIGGGSASFNPLAYATSGGSSGGLNIDFGSMGVKIGVFVLGITMIIIGIYALFKKQITGGAKTAAKAVLV